MAIYHVKRLCQNSRHDNMALRICNFYFEVEICSVCVSSVDHFADFLGGMEQQKNMGKKTEVGKLKWDDADLKKKKKKSSTH